MASIVNTLTFVNKIPPDFADKTLARLLPGQDFIATATRDELIAIHNQAAQLRKAIIAEPVKYYIPNPGGQFDFMTCDDPNIRVKLFVAGNKTGKTTSGAIAMAEAMCGEMLWGHDFRTPLTCKVPCYGVVFAETLDNHQQVTFPAYMSWCPRRFIKKVKHDSQGHPVYIEHTNGSFLYFSSYEQGSDRAEGKDWHRVWCDEPPPRNIYTSVVRGLVTLNGQLIVTATLLKEAWLFDEAMENTFVRI